jgi:putative phage-type endonuclease
MNAPQQTEQWFLDRCGKVTASRIADVMAKTKSGYGAGRKNYMTHLAIERLTGTVAESYSNAAMQWGTEQEPFAREAYEIHTGQLVIETGFVDHPSIAMSGASPDGLVGAEGLIEIKAPNSATHLDTLLTQKVPQKYLLQMHWQMACTERQTFCDFASYDPRFPEGLQLFIKRVEWDAELGAEIHAEVQKFLAELDETVEGLLKLKAA